MLPKTTFEVFCGGSSKWSVYNAVKVLKGGAAIENESLFLIVYTHVHDLFNTFPIPSSIPRSHG